VKIGSKMGKRRMISESGKSEIFAAWAFAGTDGNQSDMNKTRQIADNMANPGRKSPLLDAGASAA
jgi:hypothetical protein